MIDLSKVDTNVPPVVMLAMILCVVALLLLFGVVGAEYLRRTTGDISLVEPTQPWEYAEPEEVDTNVVDA